MAGALNRRSLLAAGGAALATPAAAQAGRSRLILLGTGGGPTPKPNRSAPAQAIVVDGAVYVIDCGNGVARQMVLAGLSLKAIRSVFITHQHSDHNADYGNLLLLAWAANLATKVDTYGPPPLAEMTRLFLQMDAYDIKTRIADEGRPDLSKLIDVHEVTRAGPVMQDSRVRVSCARVQHPPVEPAFAYRFDCPDRSIVISGDTRPSEDLVRLAKGADVLVHEVMYGPAVDKIAAAEPNAKTLKAHLLAAHTTADEVGRIATEAGVKTLVLSHFVPGGLPAIPDETWLAAVRPHFAGRIVVGRDLLAL
ncbi:MBL fold metallo-hydrolase [Phenylobacterium sp.]|uniref:MBL fold metallo-hydrolase n=1 Tax=Phenylobacterium sp. TaxID=1871053 RepID=UPI002F3E9DAA